MTICVVANSLLLLKVGLVVYLILIAHVHMFVLFIYAVLLCVQQSMRILELLLYSCRYS